MSPTVSLRTVTCIVLYLRWATTQMWNLYNAWKADKQKLGQHGFFKLKYLDGGGGIIDKFNWLWVPISINSTTFIIINSSCFGWQWPKVYFDRRYSNLLIWLGGILDCTQKRSAIYWDLDLLKVLLIITLDKTWQKVLVQGVLVLCYFKVV